MIKLVESIRFVESIGEMAVFFPDDTGRAREGLHSMQLPSLFPIWVCEVLMKGSFRSLLVSERWQPPWG